MNPKQPSADPTIAPADLPSAQMPPEKFITDIYDAEAPAVKALMLAQLVGKVYEVAPDPERGRLLDQLMRPLGILSLFAISNGIFAKLRLRSVWPAMQVRLDDIQSVRVTDVVALASHVQQVSLDAFDGLAQILLSSPTLAGSAAATVLITLLMQHARNRRAEDAKFLHSVAKPG